MTILRYHEQLLNTPTNMSGDISVDYDSISQQISYISWLNISQGIGSTTTVATNDTDDPVCSTGSVSWVFQILFMTVTSFSILIGNSMFVMTVLYSPAFHNPKGIILTSIACANVMVGIEAFYGLSVVVNCREIAGDTFCDVIGFVCGTAVAAAMYNMACLSLEQWLHIHYPLHYQHLVTNTRTALVIILTWVVCFFLHVPYFFHFFDFELLDSVYICSAIVPTRENEIGILVIKSLIVLPSMAVIIICTSLSFRTAHLHVKQIIAQEAVNHLAHLPPGKRTSQFRHYRTTVITIIVFSCVWLPQYVIQAYVAISQTYLNSTVIFITEWILISNSYVNFIIFVVTNRTFRTNLIELLSLKRCKRRFRRRNSVQPEQSYEITTH